MNFNIDLNKLGELPMTNLIIIGIFAILCIFIYKLPELINAWQTYQENTTTQSKSYLCYAIFALLALIIYRLDVILLAIKA